MFFTQRFAYLVGCATLALLTTRVDALTIDTPSGLTMCLPSAITWKDGQPPVYISAYPKGDISKEAYTLITKSSEGSGSFSWTVNLEAGTVTTLGIRDSTGTVQATAPVTVYAPPAGTEGCKTIKPYDQEGTTGSISSGGGGGGGGSSSGSGGSGSSSGSGSGSSSGSSPPGNKTAGTTSPSGGKNTTGTDVSGAKNTTSTTTNTTTPTSPGGNSSGMVNGTQAHPSNDAPSNLWLGSSEQNYILIISFVLCTAMAVMIGAWSE